MLVSFGTLKLIFALIIFIIILLAGFIPFRKHINNDHIDFPIGETLATGVFLGAACMHMLPESNTLFHDMGYQYPFAYLITGIVFLFFLWFEHLGKELYHHHQASHPAFAILAWVMFSIHSLMLGTALGLNDHDSMIIMLFLAIIAHKWAESFAMAIQLNKSALSRRIKICLFLSFSFMTPLGIFIGWYFGQGLETNLYATHSLLDAILLAASAGTFLYLGTLHGLERCVMVERCCNLKDFSFVIIGFLMMSVVAMSNI